MTEAALSPAVLRDKGLRAHMAGEPDAAMRAYADYLARVPGDAVIWSNLGALHRKQGRHLQARRAHDRAVQADPWNETVLNNAANCYSDIGLYDRSIALRQTLLAARPGDPQQLALIGRCLRGKGDYAGAIRWLTDALGAHPDDPELHMQLAFAQLGAGDYAAGFESYRHRWRAGEVAPRDLHLPEWGGGDLAGKTIAVLPEQGFGDAILFARFVAHLKGRGGRVVMPLKAPLRRLLGGVDGVDEVTDRQPSADLYVNMMDLALSHFREEGRIPPPAALTIPEDSHARARQILAPHAGTFNVGIVWTGSVTYKGNAFRSMSHRDVAPLADLPGVQLFSLYKGPELAPYHADGTDAFIIDTGGSERDFADTAAMMQALDLVITTDTATAHLAGSLGIPAWVVLHWDPFWVFRHAGETTGWYPTLRLFRQETPLDWSGVMARVAQAVRTRTEDHP
ncbi:tetratricopeptide repeat protein [Salipiger sp. IMCC34102]|uniref:tetratricopeptide repeat protein n=1 Tax=Salipiger sp. IMCC34102 TaxID=2510647 RepID=UPI00101E152B|nr:tetratricopeptide repeat protein [Salipiger sp. IMCC34102]RYH03876.1 tetratricopeptide repeat protein [Salipiger sp. IMCC34102]